MNRAAVLTIEPAGEEVRAIRPAATLALVQHCQGKDEILTTDDQCPSGLDSAARTWAEVTGAAYASRVPS